MEWRPSTLQVDSATMLGLRHLEGVDIVVSKRFLKRLLFHTPKFKKKY